MRFRRVWQDSKPFQGVVLMIINCTACDRNCMTGVSYLDLKTGTIPMYCPCNKDAETNWGASKDGIRVDIDELSNTAQLIDDEHEEEEDYPNEQEDKEKRW